MLGIFYYIHCVEHWNCTNATYLSVEKDIMIILDFLSNYKNTLMWLQLWKLYLTLFSNRNVHIFLFLIWCSISLSSSPWPYANLEKGYDLVTGGQAPERIFRWVLHFWCISWVHGYCWPSVTLWTHNGMMCLCLYVCVFGFEQSIQLNSWQMHIDTVGWTHKYTSCWGDVLPMGSYLEK